MVFPCQAMGLWGILWFLIFLGKSWGQDQRYVISAPDVFHVGTSENIAIQAHGYTEAFTATVSIKSYPDGRIKYSSDSVNLSPENDFQNSAILTIQPTQLSEGENSASHVYLEIVSKHFSNWKKIQVIDTNGSLFNHAEKLLHTPHHSDYQLAKKLTRVRRDLEMALIQAVEGQAAKYTNPVVKKCCYAGARRNDYMTCEERAAKITIGPRCVRAYIDCCVTANLNQALSGFKYKMLHIPSTQIRERDYNED